MGLGVVPPPRAGHATANQTNAGRPAAARRGLASGPKPGSGIWSSGVAAGGQWPVVVPTNLGGGPPGGLDLTVQVEGEDPGPAPVQSSEAPEAGAHVQNQEAAACQSPHGSGNCSDRVPELDGWREGVVGTINPFSERLQSEPKPKLPVKSPIYNLRLAKCLRLMA